MPLWYSPNTPPPADAADASGELSTDAVSEKVAAAASEAKWAEARAARGSSFCPTAPLIAALLQHRCDTRPAPHKPRGVLCFDSSEVPDWPIADYLVYLCRMMQCSPSAWIQALVYIDRLEAAGVEVSLLRVHRTVITAAVLSAKMLDDSRRRNTHYARLGGIAPQEMNSLEINLLHFLDFDMYVSRDVWVAKAKYVVRFAKAKGLPCRDAEGLLSAVDEEVSLSQLRCRSPTFGASETLSPYVSPQRERPATLHRRGSATVAPERSSTTTDGSQKKQASAAPPTESTELSASGGAASLRRRNKYNDRAVAPGPRGPDVIHAPPKKAQPLAMAPTPPSGQAGRERGAAQQQVQPQRREELRQELSQQQQPQTSSCGASVAFARIRKARDALMSRGRGGEEQPHEPRQHAAGAAVQAVSRRSPTSQEGDKSDSGDRTSPPTMG